MARLGTRRCASSCSPCSRHSLRPEVPSLVPTLIVTIALVPTLLWRRTLPLLMFAIAFGVTGALQLIVGHDIQLYTIAYMLLIVYSVFRWGSGRAIVIGFAVMVVTTIAANLYPPFDPTNLIGSFAIVLLTITVGLLFRFRAGSRMRELDRAKSHEREELARDLHDTVAHHVSAIAIQAQAGLATAGTNSDAATAALRVIEAEASRTLAEMRSMVRVLRRDDAAALAPAHTDRRSAPAGRQRRWRTCRRRAGHRGRRRCAGAGCGRRVSHRAGVGHQRPAPRPRRDSHRRARRGRRDAGAPDRPR